MPVVSAALGVLLICGACDGESLTVTGWWDIESIDLSADDVGYVTRIEFGGDLTGDGVADVLLGAPGAIGSTGGTVSIVDTMRRTLSHRRLNWERNSHYGEALAVGGDRDSDSLTDYAVVGRPISAGFIELLSGPREEPVATFWAATECRSFGSVILDVDATGDGVLDIIAFEHARHPPCPQDPTVAHVYDGVTLEAQDFPVDPPGFVAVESTPDYDGDGRRDLLAAFPFAGEDQGELQLISSSGGEVLHRFVVSEPGGFFGLLFSACDGADERTVGFATGGGVPYGGVRTDVRRLDANGDITTLGEGFYVECAPDMNDDGRNDALVLAFDSLLWTVVSGRSGRVLRDLFPSDADALNVDVGGDVDGDGRADIAANTDSSSVLIVRSSGR
jgi:hypothetical protein